MGAERTSVRLVDMFVGLLIGALALALPTLTLIADAGATVSGTLLAVAVAALLTLARQHSALGVRASSGPVLLGRERPRVARAGVTGTAHHPQRPRAPGAC